MGLVEDHEQRRISQDIKEDRLAHRIRCIQHAVSNVLFRGPIITPVCFFT